MENFEEINRYGSVYLTKIDEISSNSLLLEVKNSIVSNNEVDVRVGDKLLSGCKEVTKDEDGAYFTISFDKYIAYHVINESYANSDCANDYEAGDFATFCIYNKSNYMDFILRETFANDMYPGQLQHYGLFAANHIVHIISKYEPKIKIEQSLNNSE